MLALEINDIALTLVRERDVLIEEPGFVHVDGDRVLLGSQALARARLEPIFTHNRYWHELSVQPLARPGRQLGTFADLAYAQLAALRATVNTVEAETLLVVPPHYTREQLGLLLGIAQEAGFKTLGLVDAALAAAALDTISTNTLVLDLHLHQAVVSVFEAGTQLRRVRYEAQPQLGWLALQARWVDAIAGEFVRRTRFDPLHHAQTEQQLWDRLPEWLADLDRTLRTDASPTAKLTLNVEFDNNTISIEIAPQFLLDAVAAFYSAIVQLVQRAQVAGTTFELLLAHRLAALPGLQQQLAKVRNTHITVLPAAAGALGALAHAAVIRREPQNLALVQRLPASASSASANSEVTEVPVAQRPTHVLLDHVAHAISHRPLIVGHAIVAGQRNLPVAALPGVSRSHCSIVRVANGAQLEDHSTYGTFLNGQRVAHATRLVIGDRITLGAPAASNVELRLIGLGADSE